MIDEQEIRSAAHYLASMARSPSVGNLESCARDQLRLAHRRGLEAAARAQCRQCASGYPARRDGKGSPRYHVDEREGRRLHGYCRANAILDLVEGMG